MSVGSNNLFVPTEDVVYVAPSMIVHYIDSHGYEPPESFQKAVLDCPEMGKIPYLKLIRRHGIHELKGRKSG